MPRIPPESLPRLGSEDAERIDGAASRLLAVFRCDCATSRLVLRLLETFYRRSEGSFDVVAVSQDDAATTDALVREANLTMPVLLDHPGLRVSAALAPTVVPVVIRLDGDEVVARMEGFDKARLRLFLREMAERESAPWDPSYILADPTVPDRTDPSSSRAAGA